MAKRNALGGYVVTGLGVATRAAYNTEPDYQAARVKWVTPPGTHPCKGKCGHGLTYRNLHPQRQTPRVVAQELRRKERETERRVRRQAREDQLKVRREWRENVRRRQAWLRKHKPVVILGTMAILYKRVREDYRTTKATRYEPGTIVYAPDWDGRRKACGAGLHFCPSPSVCDHYASGGQYVACLVPVAEIAVYVVAEPFPKVRAPRCAVLWECDRDGKRIAKVLL